MSKQEQETDSFGTKNGGLNDVSDLQEALDGAIVRPENPSPDTALRRHAEDAAPLEGMATPPSDAGSSSPQSPPSTTESSTPGFRKRVRVDRFRLIDLIERLDANPRSASTSNPMLRLIMSDLDEGFGILAPYFDTVDMFANIDENEKAAARAELDSYMTQLNNLRKTYVPDATWKKHKEKTNETEMTDPRSRGRPRRRQTSILRQEVLPEDVVDEADSPRATTTTRRDNMRRAGGAVSSLARRLSRRQFRRALRSGSPSRSLSPSRSPSR
ncbi:hypothetical protein JX265_013500 [Neoarthrinium moseri]|uniref:Uncharacterized protein n=1 Tax=Neoarthrinium moseri TaxID=1658444 RepID=A0A9P9W8K5_9PEZI|nr:hypothetical protein JX266_012287 [Neoarthrinium moseri]KAI1849913.1 hypothetical protein JX265_013500 [Neoarthrinium moseri]